ncbi:MAG: RNA polymerase sigma factor RpoD/SigA [Treponema sp.]|nr:RNA polymerase sigma factor RpoD/SigA [Treponema sp.]
MNHGSAVTNQEDVLQSYFTQIRKIPLLTFEEELELSKLIEKGDAAAKNRLIEANLKLVVKIARSYVTADVPLMDIIQEGNLGLMTAAGKYSHTRKVRFSTYAGWWIRQTISRYMINKRRTIRLPHRKEETLRRIQKVYHTLAQTLCRQPKVEEIAQEVGVSCEDVEMLLNMTSGFTPVDMDNRNDEYGIVEDIYEDYTYSPEQVLMRKSSRDATLRALNTLKNRERRILMYRYQFSGDEKPTLKNIGERMGLSPETVRQIEIRAIKKMRNLSDDLHTYYLEAI